MGWELLRYLVFEESLRKSDSILASLGSGWPIFGKSRLTRELIFLSRRTLDNFKFADTMSHPIQMSFAVKKKKCQPPGS